MSVCCMLYEIMREKYRVSVSVCRICERKRVRDRVDVCLGYVKGRESYRMGGCACILCERKRQGEGQSVCVSRDYVK